ncbi:hypothetical protein FOYG_17118 [Fusarium oxysporum NRRL 32931]|uniref:Uncharacterized protein n=1 Tax=Fusarium oxysporum NRRL 32931 TaxID=660029 RepID=W9HAZ1_FUSOX|nr:hypothetical protein FOYG_17118 [Fusarium oxysporum NRRL 32931]
MFEPKQAASVNTLTHQANGATASRTAPRVGASEAYWEARRKMRSEKTRLKRALKQKIRDEWTAKQAVDDIERQLTGVGRAQTRSWTSPAAISDQLRDVWSKH